MTRKSSPPHTGHGSAIQRLLAQGNARHRVGDLLGAEALYRQALSLDANQPDTLHLLGVIALQKHHLTDAVSLLRRAVSISPQPAYQLNLGLALQANSQNKLALPYFKKVLREMPTPPPEAFIGLARCHIGMNQPQQAVATLAQGAKIYAQHLPLRQAQADILKELGQLDAAMQCYRDLLEQFPGQRSVLLKLANLLAVRTDFSAALPLYQQLLTAHPEDPEAHYNLGTALNTLGKTDQAIKHLRTAVRLSPRSAPARNNLGSALADGQYLEEAASAFADAVQLAPEALEFRDNLINTRLKLADWQDVQTLRTHLIDPALTNNTVSLRPFALLGLPTRINPGEYQQLIRHHARRETQRVGLAGAVAFQHPAPQHKKRLKIAYLSSDFRIHATSHLIQGLFACHDRQRIEVIGYSTGVDDGSAERQRIARDCDAFYDLHGLPWQQLAERIHHDHIDILVDLNGFTAGDRFAALTLRPAPIQVSYLGFPGTLGSPCVDYLIADATVIPPGEEQFYDEAVVRMPHSYQVNDGQRPIGTPPTRMDCGLPEDATVFCCFCNTYKLEPMIFAVWMRILQQVPSSVLWLLGKNTTAQENLRSAASHHGIDPERLIFAPPIAHTDHLARHQLADLALDTHFYNGHTTTSDALWAGLPVITYPGQSFQSRVSLSLLKAVDMAELAVEDLDHYEQLAVHLATHPAQLDELKQRLISHRQHCPLFDTQGFARHLETAYHTMWQRYCNGAKATGFAVSP